MGPLTFAINVTLDGCIDHRVGIADNETHAGHFPTLYQAGLPAARKLELVSSRALRCGAVAVHYRRAR